MNFVAKAYPNPEIDLPEYLKLSPFPLLEHNKILMDTRSNLITNYKLIISLFQFCSWVPIPYDFIIWRRLVDNFSRYIYENPSKYVVNCDHPIK
jgi:hypothetical protein